MDGNGRHQKKKIKFKNTLFKQKKNNVNILFFHLLEKKIYLLYLHYILIH
jgi:hypothetical protein